MLVLKSKSFFLLHVIKCITIRNVVFSDFTVCKKHSNHPVFEGDI